jgi:hypothetical protein
VEESEGVVQLVVEWCKVNGVLVLVMGEWLYRT